MNSLDELINSLLDFLQLSGAPKNQNKTEEEEKWLPDGISSNLNFALRPLQRKQQASRQRSAIEAVVVVMITRGKMPLIPAVSENTSSNYYY